MLLRKCISIVVSLMLFITLPVAVFAEDPDPDDSVKTALEGHAQNAEGAAKDAEDNLNDAKDSMNDAKDAMDKLDQAVKDVDDALNSLDKQATEDAVDGAKDAVGDTTEAVDNMENPDQGDVDGVDNLADAAQDAVGKAADAVNEDARIIDEAAVKANEAVEKAKEITKSANDSLTAADNAIESANDALEQAQLADEVYRKLLQETIDGAATPSTYQALADAEDAREAAWNNYTGAMDNAFNALQGAVKDVQDAQQAAKDAYDLWVTAESTMQNEANGVEFGTLSALRTRAFEAAANACNSALDAAITALELREMADAAQGKAADAAEKTDDAAQWQRGLSDLVDTAITDLKKAVNDANEIIKTQNKAIDDENDRIDRENEKKQKDFEKKLVSQITLRSDTKGNSIQIHDLPASSKDNVILYIYNSSGKTITEVTLTLSGNVWKTPKSNLNAIDKNGCRTIIISINGVYYSVPQSDNGNWGSGMVNFNGAKKTEQIADGLEERLVKLKKLPSIKDFDGPRRADGSEMPDFDTLEKLRNILETGQFGGLDINVPETPTPPTPNPPTPTPTPPTPEPPTYFGERRGGGGGGGTVDAGGVVGGDTTIPETPVPLAETPIETIGDIPIPLASGPNPNTDTVTIIDENVPLANLPSSGGLLGMIATNIVTVDMCLPPVSKKRRRYTVKNIRKK